MAEKSKVPCHYQDTNDTLFFVDAKLLAVSLPLLVESRASGSSPISCQLLSVDHRQSEPAWGKSNGTNINIFWNEDEHGGGKRPFLRQSFIRPVTLVKVFHYALLLWAYSLCRLEVEQSLYVIVRSFCLVCREKDSGEVRTCLADITQRRIEMVAWLLLMGARWRYFHWVCIVWFPQAMHNYDCRHNCSVKLMWFVPLIHNRFLSMYSQSIDSSPKHGSGN